jgi:methanogenic corrinoid protein MtbC1
MASDFGLSGLRSRLSDWRHFRMLDRFAKFANRDGPPLSANDSASLAQLIEHHIIPQLLSQQSGLAAAPTAMGNSDGPPIPTAIGADAVRQFAELAIGGDMRALIADADRHLAGGASIDTLYVSLLAPAARLLGSDWEEDRQDFVDVTMALWRIQELLHILSARAPIALRAGTGRHSVLFATMPGDQHSLGTLMIADCFQRAGWDCDILIDPTLSELNGRLAARAYDLLGLTVTCDCPSAALHNLIAGARAVAVNPALRIMVGGRVMLDRPDLVSGSGADAMAHDAVSAIAIAEQLICEQSRLCQQP